MVLAVLKYMILLVICLSKEGMIQPITMLLHRFHARSSEDPSGGWGKLPLTKDILFFASRLIIMDLFLITKTSAIKHNRN